MGSPNLTSVDGSIVPTSEARIPASDDGLLRGDGVFEVIEREGRDHRVDGEARGDFAGVMTAHAVGDHAEPELLVNREAVFVGRPDAALIA